MGKGSVFVLMMFLAVVVSSCSSNPPNKGSEESVAPTLEETETKEVDMPVTGEAVFTYKEDQNFSSDQSGLYITLFNEPIEVPDVGFLKLKGAVVGQYPVALVEVGGRGVPLMIGDKLGSFVVKAIGKGYLKLEH